MGTKTRSGVMLSFDAWHCLQSMSYEQKGLLIDALMQYAELGVLPDLPTELQTVWHFLKQSAERDNSPARTKNTKKTNTHLILEDILPHYNLSVDLQNKLREWCDYKTERNEAYKPQGLKALLKRVETASQQHGDYAVCELIDECMASNWKGIIFDRLTAKADTRSYRQSNTGFKSSNPFLEMLQEGNYQ